MYCGVAARICGARVLLYTLLLYAREPCTTQKILRNFALRNDILNAMVGLGGLEPPTSRLSGVRSNHLSYKPITNSTEDMSLLRKEVIQPHLPIRLPCYDFTPVIDFALGNLLSTNFGRPQLPWCDGRCVQDPGTHSPQHADLRLLATPSSCRRVSACNPNWDRFWRLAPPRGFAALCTDHCSTCVAQNIRGMMI